MYSPIEQCFWAVLAHFGLESGMAFEGTTGVYERIAGFQCHAIQNRSK